VSCTAREVFGVQLEWMTVCEAIDVGAFPTINLMGANQGGALVTEDLPVTITATLAMCFHFEDAEVEHGAVLVARCEVYRSDRTRAGVLREQVIVEKGDPLPVGFQRRQILNVDVSFSATSFGTHYITARLEGDDRPPLIVTYAVLPLPTVT
jgi:hypothetical protein